MYSPKIAEHLIPRIYRLARTRGQHMTTLVNEALATYLAEHDASAQLDSAPAQTPAVRADDARQHPSRIS